MTIFVEIAPDEYDATAFSGFDASTTDFTLGNARALMWMSQLAYETHVDATISTVSAKWGFLSAEKFAADFETCGIIAERPDAVILAFAGTDPGIWKNLVTDGEFRRDPQTNVHQGFQKAATSADARIKQAAQLSLQKKKPLFIAGHSLGAALAALAALVAGKEGAEPRAVYTYGMPRTGGDKFRQGYDQRLGPKTFRLVYGIDLVARVPMSILGYRHVGRVLMCDEGAKFDPAKPLSPLGSDDPPFAGELSGIVRRAIGSLMTGRLLSKPGPGALGRFFRFIRPEIRDHLQDSYWTALTP
jgi:triacylglycerol lipase